MLLLSTVLLEIQKQYRNKRILGYKQAISYNSLTLPYHATRLPTIIGTVNAPSVIMACAPKRRSGRSRSDYRDWSRLAVVH